MEGGIRIATLGGSNVPDAAALPELSHNGTAITTIADLHQALEACAGDIDADQVSDERLGLLLHVWDGVENFLGNIEDATDPFVIEIARHVEHLPYGQRSLFANFDTRVAATKVRQDRRASLAAFISERWGVEWLTHPYALRAMRSDDLAKTFRRIVASLNPSEAVVLLSKWLIHRLTVNPPYSATSAELQVKDL
jgi:hypothetical protein